MDRQGAEVKPTIGRIVLYTAPGGPWPNARTPAVWPAVVLRVRSTDDGGRSVVDLGVFSDDYRLECAIEQADAPGLEGRTWCWPPRDG